MVEGTYDVGDFSNDFQELEDQRHGSEQLGELETSDWQQVWFGGLPQGLIWYLRMRLEENQTSVTLAETHVLGKYYLPY